MYMAIMRGKFLLSFIHEVYDADAISVTLLSCRLIITSTTLVKDNLSIIIANYENLLTHSMLLKV